MVSVSTHVLDARSGRPATGVGVVLEGPEPQWRPLADGVTDADGRVADLAGADVEGAYRLRFDTGGFFDGDTFYPEVVVTFSVRDVAAHHHVPLLLSPFAYTTYRGS